MATDLHYPLPSISTLQRYAQKLDLKQGILEDVLDLIGNFSENFHSRDRECVLSFDEMKVSKTLEYDPASDEVIGPHDYMQVVMARGLFKKWKQPIFIGFDKPMTKDIILEIIRRLQHKGINVVAILNQDVLKNFFSQVRQVGGVYDHPSPLSSIYRIRMMILGKSPSILRNQTDTNSNNIGEEFITATENIESEYNFDEQNEAFISATVVFSAAEVIPCLPDVEAMEKINGMNIIDGSEIVSTFLKMSYDLCSQSTLIQMKKCLKLLLMTIIQTNAIRNTVTNTSLM
uniref:Transposable element P transposase-like RNase H domain-containing protein n=1 Tax=Anopheles dirus TaxID=7168 RepID=A0A182NSV7_9DIPT